MIRVQEFLRNLAPILLICFPFILPAQVSNPVADLAINAYNDAFLTTSNGRTYYKRALDDNSHDGTWTLALDIQGMQDAYERTGDPVHKEIINDLCRSFLLFNPTPYSWDGWNDDLAWMALVLVRGYQMTGVENFLTEAESTFNLAFDRGWNTHFNDGGIWEQQPDFVGEDAATNKEALSNNPMGQLACMLYQSTGNEYYLDKAKQIYEWSWSHLFNPANGQVYAGVYRNEYINKGTAVYNQGTFIDFATLLYELTGDKRILRDARMSADFTIKHFTTNGILSNTAGYLNTWAAEFARGLGHLCKANPQLWDIYYPFLKENADAGWSNRRKDLNLTWNGWDQPTPEDPAGIPTKYVSLVSLLQFTPTIQSIPGTIKAEDYNYMNGMEVQDIGAGAKAISAAGADEWVEYIIDVPAEGYYTFSFSVASPDGGEFIVQENNLSLDKLTIPATGDLQTYSTVSASLKLNSGKQAIKLKSFTGEWYIDSWSAESCSLIEPSISINDAEAQQITNATVNVGDDITLGGSPANGVWNWTGPNDFASTTREISISNIQYAQGGVYTAYYQNAEGCISVQDFKIAIDGCSPTEIITNISVYDNGWKQADTELKTGSYIRIEGSPTDGSWKWSGPNGFSSMSNAFSFLSITNKQAGDYTATFVNANGCESSAVITIAVSGDDPCSTPITPYVNISDGWKEVAYGSVNAGGSVSVGPHPLDPGVWGWTGPDNFSSNTREFTINNFSSVNAGYYTATFTNEQGCKSSNDFVIGLEGCSKQSIVPEIMVNETIWPDANLVTLASGDNITITPPDVNGFWSWKGSNGGPENWSGANAFTSNSRQISFDDVLSVRNGTYTLTFTNEEACRSTHAIDISVAGDDYCGTPITPYLTVNDGAWLQTTTATLEVGDNIRVGPHPMDNDRWNWIGPNGFTSTDREIAIENIQAAQFGIYEAKCTNNFGCRSFMHFALSTDAVGINLPETLDNAGLVVFPNPAKNVVTLINLKSNNPIALLDLSGTVIKQFMPSGQNGKLIMDISNLKPGVYYLKPLQSNQDAVKLIKL